MTDSTSISPRIGASEAASKLVERLQKNRNKMFTFLDFDDVPWNNNNAEHAVKAFASLRRVIDGSTTEKGLRDFLDSAESLRDVQIQECRFPRFSALRFEGHRRFRDQPTEATHAITALCLRVPLRVKTGIYRTARATTGSPQSTDIEIGHVSRTLLKEFEKC